MAGISLAETACISYKCYKGEITKKECAKRIATSWLSNAVGVLGGGAGAFIGTLLGNILAPGIGGLVGGVLGSVLMNYGASYATEKIIEGSSHSLEKYEEKEVSKEDKE